MPRAIGWCGLLCHCSLSMASTERLTSLSRRTRQTTPPHTRWATLLMSPYITVCMTGYSRGHRCSRRRASETEDLQQVQGVPSVTSWPRSSCLSVEEVLFSYFMCRAVVVLIDSDNFPKEVRAVAELVYDLLLEPTVHKGGTPLLMACNKQDLPLAKDCSAIQKQLEKEM